MKREKIYQGIILFMLIGFLLFFIKTDEIINESSATNDELISLVDQQREDNEEIISQWENSYEELQCEYGALLVEKHQIELNQKQVEIPVYDFTEAEVYLIAQCVEAEAGYYEGHELSQQYVTQVILNRLHSGQFPNSVEEVIYQKTDGCPQFSVAYNGMMDDREVEPETLANVYSVLVHGTDLPEYVLYFYSASVTENWVNTLNTYTTESGTVFAYESKEVY